MGTVEGEVGEVGKNGVRDLGKRGAIGDHCFNWREKHQEKFNGTWKCKQARRVKIDDQVVENGETILAKEGAGTLEGGVRRVRDPCR